MTNILLNDYESYQKIYLSKIICNKCKKYNTNIINQEYFKCDECQINLHLLCKFKHDKNHHIINYTDKNFICKKHYERYV